MRRRRRAWNIAVLTILGSCIVSYFVVGGFYGLSILMNGYNPFRWMETSREGLEESRRRGEEAVAAIEAFKELNDRYPASLDEVFSKQARKRIEPTIGSCRWEYELHKDMGFVLEHFIGPLYERAWYEGIPGKWRVDD